MWVYKKAEMLEVTDPICFFILFSTVDEDEEEDTEIRIVKRVEDYYPENKFTARSGP